MTHTQRETPATLVCNCGNTEGITIDELRNEVNCPECNPQAADSARFELGDDGFDPRDDEGFNDEDFYCFDF